MLELFEVNKIRMEAEYANVDWIESSGLSPDELKRNVRDFIHDHQDMSNAMMRASVFSYICCHAQIAVNQYDIFQDQIRHEGIMTALIHEKRAKIRQMEMKELADLAEGKCEEGCYNAHDDLGHVCSDWGRLLELGFSGILNQINTYLGDDDLSESKKEFYITCKIFYEAAIVYTKRLAAAVLDEDSEKGQALLSLSVRAPENFHEALQLIFLYYYLHENVSGARERTLGRLDQLLYGFYRNDVENGTFTTDEIREMIKYFLYRMWLLKVPFDLPMMLGGLDENGHEVTNELSHMIIEEYDKLHIYSPKIHIRVSNQTPDDFLLKIMSAIRKGNSSFLLVNDNIAIPALEHTGMKKELAYNYILIGCYEPAVFGCEIPCTGNGEINIVKALEYALLDDTVSSFEDLIQKLFLYYRSFAEDAMRIICNWEKHYMKMYNDPLLSATFESCMQNGRDAYDGGALYNNSSLNVKGIGTLIDSLAILHKYVYEDQRITMNDFRKILRCNWKGHENLRKEIRNCSYRYGNGCAFADELMARITSHVASIITGKPNGRGGVFKAGLYSIDRNVYFGSRTGATPDGRHAGDNLSKNLCPTAGMEFHGITEVIKSVSKIDATLFPNGSVLDLVFHPTAVCGEDGLRAMLGIYRTYFALGGFAMHSNVFDASELRKAQSNPEEYQNLQVRVCGWNVYFVNLSRKEQDDFIRQAENTMM